jgi:hypothetical protein
MKKTTPVDCYISSFVHPHMEAYLEANGFARGMILFSIPGYGVLFKCRAQGRPVDLEFGAFFSLLRFLKKSLSKDNITAVHVHSSNPEFVFALANASSEVSKNPERKKMLAQNTRDFQITVSYTPPINNKTLVPPTEYPSTPEGQLPPFKPDVKKETRTEFRPIQKGINL